VNLETSLARTLAAHDAGGDELAHRDAVTIGPLLAEPALRRIAAPGAEPVSLQPLAMRVLLALHDAEGATLSRDDLVRLCWGQRIVGDDAVHRIISTLRRDLAQASGTRVSIETIPKVGYRLRLAERPTADATPPPAESSSKPGKTRRWFGLLSLTAAAVTGGVFAFAPARTGAVTTIAIVADQGSVRGPTTRFAAGLSGDLAQLAGAMPSLAFVEPAGEAGR
jgi:DNA-binding winged helix-turn-helix (wHTH) protein